MRERERERDREKERDSAGSQRENWRSYIEDMRTRNTKGRERKLTRGRKGSEWRRLRGRGTRMERKKERWSDSGQWYEDERKDRGERKLPRGRNRRMKRGKGREERREREREIRERKYCEGGMRFTGKTSIGR